jgi:hypothetical protein
LQSASRFVAITPTENWQWNGRHPTSGPTKAVSRTGFSSFQRHGGGPVPLVVMLQSLGTTSRIPVQERLHCAMTISDEYFGQLKRVDSDWYEAWIDRPCNGTASRLKVTFTAECEGTMIATIPVIRATLQTYLESSITRIRKYLRDLMPTAYIGELIRIDIWCDIPARSAGRL